MAGKPLELPHFGNKGEARPTTMQSRQMDPVRATEDSLQDLMTQKKYGMVIGDDQTKALYDKAIDKAAKAHMSAVSKVFPQSAGAEKGSGIKYPPAKGYGR